MKNTILAFDEIRSAEYAEAVEAKELGAAIVANVEEHRHLADATIGYVFRDDELTRHGKVIVAEAILVERILPSDKRWSRFIKWSLQRVLSGNLPDFLVLIDRNLWDGFDAEQKLALIDHELSHCWYATEDDGTTQKFHQDGSPWWTIRGHDLEEFCGVVDRRGLWNEDLRVMARSIVNRLAGESRKQFRAV